MSYQDHPGVLYRDLLGGRYEAVTVAPIPAGAKSLAALDANNDSFVDVSFSGGLALNYEGTFGAGPQSADHAYVYADLENRGLLDLATGPETRRGKGLAQWDAPRAAAGLSGAAALAAADFDVDGRMDLFAVKPDGTLARFTNQTPLKNNWLRVQLTGIKNLKLAPGAEIEVKTGALYEKRLYAGVPLLFGLRGYTHRRGAVKRSHWPGSRVTRTTRTSARTRRVTASAMSAHAKSSGKSTTAVMPRRSRHRAEEGACRARPLPPLEGIVGDRPTFRRCRRR